MGSQWKYTTNREILWSEFEGWIPHCVPYRERQRSMQLQVHPLVTQAGAVLKEIPLREKEEYMLDRNNRDRADRADYGADLTYWSKETVVNHAQPATARNWTGQISQPANYVRGLWIPGVWTNQDTGNQISPLSLPSSVAESSLNTLGAQMVNQALPTIAASNLGVALTELYREGIPRATLATFRQLSNMTRGAADDFLNYQFGWKPLVKEVLQLRDVLSNKANIISQLERDAGRLVRRRRGLPPVNTTTAFRLFGTQVYPGSNGLLYSTEPGALGTLTTTTNKWFSGAFRYYLPTGNSRWDRWFKKSLELDRLYGLSLTPETLWEIAPWSWLVDWESNMGDVISNATKMAQYGMVMPYAYVMWEVTREYRFTGYIDAQSNRRFDGPNPRFDVTYRTVRRYRRKANPFGFGVTWESLDKTQLGILAALGLTKLNRGD
jgi:hypothetical protein